MGKAENEAKKEFLWSYRDSVRRLERISAEIEEIRAMRMGASAGTGGTGRRGWKNDLSAYAAQLDSLERKPRKMAGFYAEPMCHSIIMQSGKFELVKKIDRFLGGATYSAYLYETFYDRNFCQ